MTKHASFSNVNWRGEESRPLVVVDTPGHDDSSGAELDSQEARDTLGAIAADLHNKLKALGHVHAILVLHNDVLSNRLNPATYQILKMVDEKFVKAGGSVWNHVIVGYSKCNSHDISWRSGLEAKRAALRAAIKEKIGGCEVDLPVVALGGGEIDPAPPSHDEADGIEAVWQFVEEASALDTSSLQPFEGLDAKWQKIVDARDLAEARAKAALIYTAIVLKLAILGAILFWRQLLLPAWISILLLNFEGLYDEFIICALFVHWVGPRDVYHSSGHFYRVWLEPRIDPYVQQYLAPLIPALAKEGSGAAAAKPAKGKKAKKE